MFITFVIALRVHLVLLRYCKVISFEGFLAGGAIKRSQVIFKII